MSYPIIKSSVLWIAYTKDRSKIIFIEAEMIGHAHRTARKQFGPGVSFSVREPNAQEKSMPYIAYQIIDGDKPENWG